MGKSKKRAKKRKAAALDDDEYVPPNTFKRVKQQLPSSLAAPSPLKKRTVLKVKGQPPGVETNEEANVEQEPKTQNEAKATKLSSRQKLMAAATNGEVKAKPEANDEDPSRPQPQSQQRQNKKGKARTKVNQELNTKGPDSQPRSQQDHGKNGHQTPSAQDTIRQSQIPQKATEAAASKRALYYAVSDSESDSASLIPPLLIAFSRFPERPNQEDRNTEAKLYEYLGDEDKEIRHAAALAVARGLLGEHRDYPVSDVELERHMTRLFRGLASGRNASRLGFSVVLTEILKTLFGIPDLERKYKRFTFRKALDALTNNVQLGCSSTKTEEKNYHLGQLFGLECLIKARVIAVDGSRWGSLLEKLVDLAITKSTLREACGKMIVQAVDQFDKAVAKETLSMIKETELAKTAEGLAVWLAVLERFPEIHKNPWKDPFKRTQFAERLPLFSRALGEESALSSAKGQNSTAIMPSNWRAQVHFVWDWIARYFLKAGNELSETFGAFWKAIFDDILFSPTSTEQRKYQGFLIFQKMLSALTPHHHLVISLFTPKFLSCLMNQAAVRKRHLHSAAVKVLSTIENTASKDPSLAVPILTGLIFSSGTYAFDQRSKSKTATNVLQCVTDRDAPAIMKLLEQPVLLSKKMEPGDRERLATEYIKYLHKLATAQRNNSEITILALDKLCRLSFAKDETLSDYGMGAHAKEFCREHLDSALAKVTNSARGFDLFCGVVCAFDPKLVDMDAEVAAKRKIAAKAFANLIGTTGDDCQALQALGVLYALVLFHIYGGDPDAIVVLSDLEVFRERFDNKRDDGATTVFLVEILLSLIARPSPLVRQISKHVFGKFAPHLSTEALKLLTEPLFAEENLEGHRKIFATEGEMDMSDGDLNSEVDVLEMGEGDLAGSETEAGDGSNESESDEDAEEEEAGDAEADAQQKAFEDDLAKLLKTHRPDQEDDTESEAGSDMTDTEMMAIDGQISAAFKGRKAALPPSKKDHKNAKESVIQFKNRILDLVNSYLECGAKRKEDGSRLVAKRSVLDALQLLPDLVHLAGRTTSKDLAKRVSSVLGDYKNDSKKERGQWVEESRGEGGDENKSGALAALRRIHDNLGSQESHAFARTASTACLTLAAALQAVGMLEDVKELYEATKKEKGCKVQRSFFESWQHWCQSQKA